jgi:hypothetical protein
MQFDPWAIEPPLGEFSHLVGWLCVAGCVLGWASCLWTLVRRKTSPADWSAWRWGLLGGAVAGLGMLIGITSGVDLDPFVGLFPNWIIGSSFGAGIVVVASRDADRRALGRRIIETVALFVLGLPMPAIAAAGAIRLGAR